MFAKQLSLACQRNASQLRILRIVKKAIKNRGKLERGIPELSAMLTNS